jgi:hypothetical protein
VHGVWGGGGGEGGVLSSAVLPGLFPACCAGMRHVQSAHGRTWAFFACIVRQVLAPVELELSARVGCSVVCSMRQCCQLNNMQQHHAASRRGAAS